MTTDATQVTQEDRNVADAWQEAHFDDSEWFSSLVQAFARHRTAAEAAAWEAAGFWKERAEQLERDKAAFDAEHLPKYQAALASKEAELAAERVEAYTARHMREIAQGLGYPSILEALEDVSELRAEVEKLREALHDAICMIGHAMRMDTTVLAGQRLVARDVWQTGYDLLHPKPKKEIA